MRITNVLDAVFDRDVGWRPVSGSIKPVHIANGLFRSLLRARYNVSRTVTFLRPNGKDTKHSYEYMVQETSDPKFAAFADSARKGDFEQLREYARGLLAADKAVFPSADQSSLSLTCREMISPDNNDRKVGAFAAALLNGKDDKGKLGQLVRKWLPASELSPGDPITALAWPLLSHEPEPLANDKPTALEKNAKTKPIIDQLEAAAAQLAEHESSNQNRLVALERTVHFSVLGLLAHAQALASGGDLDARPPLILTACAEKGSGLALASEESLMRFFRGFEDFLVDQLRERLERKLPVYYKSPKNEGKTVDVPAQRRDSIRNFFQKIEGYKGGQPTDKVLNERVECWQRNGRLPDKSDASLVMARTLVECYLNENGGGNPRGFLQGIGCRAGIIYPHFEGRSGEKRIRPTVPILEVLVKACTPDTHPVPEREFLNTLWNTFGYVTGGRPDDALLLNEAGLDVSYDALSENWEQLVTRLADIGLARRYPDNISYIGRFHA